MTVSREHCIIGIDASRSTSEQQTGTERYSRRIIQELLDLGINQRFRLYLNAMTPMPLRQRAYVEQRLIPFPRLWTHLRLSSELARHPVDVLFVPAHVVPPVRPAATVVTIHDLGYLYEPAAHTSLSRTYLDWSTRWSVRAARSIIAISEATKRDLVQFYGVPPHKVSVVYHGIDERFQPASRSQISRVKQELGIGDQFILFVGTIQPRKNVVRLIDAFTLIADERDRLQIVLAGKIGWKSSEIERAISASRHSDRILLLGHVPDGDLPALYSASSAFALPSLYEGFGLPALEALACGTPVLVSDRGSLPEVVGDAAAVVDPTNVAEIADGLRHVLDVDGRADRIERGRVHASKFSWEKTGRQTLEILRNCQHLHTG